MTPALKFLGCWAVTVALSGCDLKAFTVNTTAPVLKMASDGFAAENDLVLVCDAVFG